MRNRAIQLLASFFRSIKEAFHRVLKQRKPKKIKFG